MSKKEFIEINGRKYDTRTGEVLHQSKDKSSKSSLPPSISDDIEVTHGSHKKPHKVAKNHVPHKRQRAKTLLRSAVKKPSFKKPGPQVSKASSSLDKLSPSGALEKYLRRNEDRSERAGKIAKSGLINKFNDKLESQEDQAVQHIEVKTQPPVETAATVAAIHEAKQEINPFDNAVERSTSHEEKYVAPHRPLYSRLSFQVLLVFILFVVVSTAVLYLKAPSLDLSLAGYRANVSAIMPGELPSGFHLQAPVSYSSGQVLLTFVDGSNTIQIIEENTNFDSQTLLKNFVALTGKSYIALPSGNGTVYQFSDGSATWASKGIWYQLSSNIPLAGSQIQSIASTT